MGPCAVFRAIAFILVDAKFDGHYCLLLCKIMFDGRRW